MTHIKPIRIGLEVLASKIRQKKKDTHIRKEEVKMSLSADDTILCEENPGDSIKNC